jgi:hypothetical protein
VALAGSFLFSDLCSCSVSCLNRWWLEKYERRRGAISIKDYLLGTVSTNALHKDAPSRTDV